VAARRKSIAWLAAALLLPALAGNADAQQIDTIKDIVTRLHGCWKPPPPSRAGPMDITVMVSFNREGSILGRPRITSASPGPLVQRKWDALKPRWRSEITARTA